MSRRHQAAVIGMGLAAFSAAARLTELGIEQIALYAAGPGSTPYIAAMNLVTENPYGDTPERYCEDILQAGCGLGGPELAREMAFRTGDCYELLCRWGARFAREPDGTPARRRVPGNSCPRALYRTDRTVGSALAEAVLPRLEAKGVQIFRGCEVVDLLTTDGAVDGFLVREGGTVYPVYAPVVLAAWGGAGGLLGRSTYPGDVKGNTLGMAKLAGASMTDMEFLEFEPMVLLDPPAALGEPVPIGLLREGGHLLTAGGRRFLTDGQEAGASKPQISQEIWRQTAAGQGAPHGGVLLDLRGVSRAALGSHPWFLHRLTDSGLDPQTQCLEVGPVPHSFLGGIQVDRSYQSTVKGLYAAGEACGGIHGASRCAGNAGTQAAVSGMLCAGHIARSAQLDRVPREHPAVYAQDLGVRGTLLPRIQQNARAALGVYREETALKAACETVQAILNSEQISKDLFTRQSATAAAMMLQAALERRESRGAHNRLDFPEQDPRYGTGIVL